MRKRAYIAVTLAVIAALGIGYLFDRKPEQPKPSPQTENSCKRVVSLAPSITESLFALGLGNRIVGVTRYCNYPKEARTKQKVGGYADPNYELIFDLKPTQVFLLDLHHVANKALLKLNLSTQTVRAESIRDIYTSIETIGQVCGVEERGATLIDSLEQRLNLIRQKTEGRPKPRVLISVGRSMGSGSLEDTYVAGRRSFFNEVLALAGGENAMGPGSVVYPRLSAEGVLHVEPDVIVDLVVNRAEKNISKEEVRGQWRSLARTKAVKNGRVHVLGQDYVVVPGPRFVLLVEQLARLFHPSGNWS